MVFSTWLPSAKSKSIFRRCLLRPSRSAIFSAEGMGVVSSTECLIFF
jgi:hypothetical protein